MDNSKNSLNRILKIYRCSSFILLRNGKSVYEFGDITDTFNIASIRKSLLSILIGIYWDRGIINLQRTLENLQIDDSEPRLTHSEKQATIEDLLKMRSGIYHEANFETKSAKDSKPARGSYKRNEHYYYNNWDSNTLGTIFTKLTGKDVFNSFSEEIALRIGMQDFDVNNCEYIVDANSIHKAYKFRMSVRDLALFGQLILDKGKYNNQQIVSEEWIDKSLSIYSIDKEGKGVGYLWDIENKGKLWGNITYPDRSFGFSGYPGHFLLIIPSEKIVAVYGHTIGNKEKEFITSEEFERLAEIILRFNT